MGVGGVIEFSFSNFGKMLRMLVMFGKGDIEVVNVWGFGLIDVLVRFGFMFGFCLKCKN